MRTLHMCVSVAGALKNRAFKGMTDDKGRPLTEKEAEFRLRVLADKGVKVLPMSADCHGFSYQTGCPGHEVPADEETIQAS